MTPQSATAGGSVLIVLIVRASAERDRGEVLSAMSADSAGPVFLGRVGHGGVRVAAVEAACAPRTTVDRERVGPALREQPGPWPTPNEEVCDMTHRSGGAFSADLAARPNPDGTGEATWRV